MRLLLRIVSLGQGATAFLSGVATPIVILLVLLHADHLTAQNRYVAQMELDRGHYSTQWAELARHLPDRLTSSAETLERQGDILRARRFPDDANDFYNFALQKGGNPAVLLNKIGMTELDTRDLSLARAYFKRAVAVDRKDAQGWNNLGVVEHVQRRLPFAIENYQRAVRLDPACAVFHANLAIAFLDHAEFNLARREIAAALRLDPAIFETEGDSGGASARVVSSQGRSRLLLELARLYAHSGDEPRMIQALAAAGEAGVDVRREMRHDHVLAGYLDDPRVIVLYRNSQLLHMIGEPDPTEPRSGIGAGRTGD